MVGSPSVSDGSDVSGTPTTDLEHIAEVNEHVMRLLHAARDVKARRDHVARLAALVEIVRDGQVKPPAGRIAEALR